MRIPTVALILAASCALEHVHAFSFHNSHPQPEVRNSSSLPSSQHGKTSAAGCGVVPERKTVEKQERRFRRLRKASRSKGRPKDGVEFPVQWHVITSAEGRDPDVGGVEQWQIDKSMAVLNHDFRDTGVRFAFAGVDYHVDPEWYSAGVMLNVPLDAARKALTRIGDEKTLNIWTVGYGATKGAKGYIAYATFPGEPLEQDGVIINRHALVDGGWWENDLGHVLSHEAGHWVGLYHTFQDGEDCSGDGDQVADTAPHRGGSGVCNSHAPSSCGGAEPVFNFMNYVDDACRQEFTKGQIDRMWDQIVVYRS